jgi:hypothetical protein
MFAQRTDWPLAPNRLSALLREMRAAGGEILDLTESNPTRCGFNYPEQWILEALTQRGALTYDPDPRGLLGAREAVARYYAESGATLSPEQIFLTTSTSEAYSYLFKLLANPGDAVLVPRPSYPLFQFLADLNDVKLIPYPLRYHDRWEIDFAALAAAFEQAAGRARALIVVHPNNPTGSYLSREESAWLAALCRERGCAIIADEVFRDFAFDPAAAPAPTHAAGTRALTFTLSGLSKISALPQMKLAWLAASGPEELLSPALARLEVIADTYLSLSAPLALALPRWLETRGAIQHQILERVRGNLQSLDGALPDQVPLTRLKAAGGWYGVLRVPATRSDEDWALRLLQQHRVFVHPGHFYDFDTDGFLVVSLLPPPAVFREGIKRLMLEVSQ